MLTNFYKKNRCIYPFAFHADTSACHRNLHKCAYTSHVDKVRPHRSPYNVSFANVSNNHVYISFNVDENILLIKDIWYNWCSNTNENLDTTNTGCTNLTLLCSQIKRPLQSLQSLLVLPIKKI